ncbi:MAG: amino acid ABC transporter substrate-binding protein [Deltaproteobacteria bacterium]|nr:amino acid ABC transporter substrate-binding protein [Deltaproteobacteria bacterium]
MKKSMAILYLLVSFCLLSTLLATGGPAMAKEQILIGAHLPLSGSGASMGAEQKWAYNLAVADINKAGGIYVKEYDKKLPVKLIIMDDESEPMKAASAVAKLIKQKKVDLILSGQRGAYGVIPGMITAEKFKKYYHGTVIWFPDFLKNNFQWCTVYFFDIGQGATIPYEVWNSLPEDQRPKKPAIFMEDTTDGSQMGGGLTALAGKYGYTIALRETMPLGGKDFSKSILRAKSKGVDAILCMANAPEAITLLKQMKKLNLNVKFFQGWKGTWQTQFQKTMGKDAEGVFCDGFWSMDFPFPGAKELGKRHYAQYKRNSVSIGLYYALCQILWQAIEKSGSLDGAKVRQAVLDNEFDTVMGKVDYNEKGVAVFPLANFQWKDGKRVVVYPFDRASAKAVPMKPWNQR